MALGIDTICAEIVLALKKAHPQVQLECAIPCLEQERFWPLKAKKRYQKILKNCNKITMVSDQKYFDGCMIQRNKYVVDNCDLLIAVYNHRSGGTKMTIDYAKSIDKPAIVINLDNPKEIEE